MGADDVSHVARYLSKKTVMQRNLDKLADQEFDLLIIGGGIYGATVAWEAVLHGLKVALVEKSDFVSATSSNSLKIIHGGLRYLQHADFVRMRESIRERRVLMQIAPHLVHPMPCIMPTYGHAIKGPEVMRMALLMNDIISIDRNKVKDRQKHIPMGRVVSKREMQELVPWVNPNNLTGGALWYDAHMVNSERLALSFIKSAVMHGAVVANYVKAEQFVFRDGRIKGALVRDQLSGDQFEIRSKMTITTAGPWINNLLAQLNGRNNHQPIAFSTALNLVVKRELTRDLAFGLPSRYEFKDADAIINRGSRLLFVVPWRGYSIIGTAHKPWPGSAEDFRVTEGMINEFLDEVNNALEGLEISRDDVTYFYGGLLPMSGHNPHSGDVTIEKHFRIIDHEMEDGLPGLLSLLSVKYTTARGVAEKAVDQVLAKLGRKIPKINSEHLPLWGGEIESFREFINEPVELPEDIGIHLKTNFGSGYREVINLTKLNPAYGQRLSQKHPYTEAEIRYTVREEMSEHLSDIIMRRTDIGTAGKPEPELLLRCADIMADEKGWKEEKKQEEIKAVEKLFQPA